MCIINYRTILTFLHSEHIKYQTVYHDITRNTPLMTRVIENKAPFIEYLDNIPPAIDILITVAAINTNLNLLGEPASTMVNINEPGEFLCLNHALIFDGQAKVYFIFLTSQLVTINGQFLLPTERL